MHLINYVLIGAVLLLLFGPKLLQSLARNAGKATGELRQAKDRLMADPSLEEVMNVKKSLDRLPTTPEKAVRMMLTPADKPTDKNSGKSSGSDTRAASGEKAL
jgi:Sec-independent protein secretion pathway components